MRPQLKAKEPFIFYTRFNLQELTGLKAFSLEQLLRLIKDVPGSSIYHHTHRFVEKHQYLSLEPPNDFACWVDGVLGEKTLGEILAGIDTVQFPTIHDLRMTIVATLEEYINEHPKSKKRFAEPGAEFHFIKSVSVIVPTHYQADSLEMFIKLLQKVSISSIYFHMFEARLRLERKTNDFSWWLETSILNKPLADKIARLDPYTFNLEGLRARLIGILEKETSS